MAMSVLNDLAIATGLKEPPRRRGPGKKTLAKLNGQNGEKALKLGPPMGPQQLKRAYKEIVGIGGINSDWALSGISEDSDVWQNIFALRSRSRDLFRTDVYFKKYKEELWANVYGAEGITCRMEIKEQEDRVVYSAAEKSFLRAHERRRMRIANYLERRFGERKLEARQTAQVLTGDMDLYANNLIEKAWREWKRRDYCTVAGCLDYNEVCQIRLLSAARDGDFFLRHIRSPSINKYGYALQLINSEWCDFALNTRAENGNEIRMGIERDKWGRRVAYYFIKRSPMDWQFGIPGAQTGAPKTYQRILAEEIIHYARYEDGDSTRPAPWSTSVIQKSRHLDKYEEAEVVAARVSACKLGFFTSNMVPEGGEAMGDRPDPTAEATMDAEPGSFTGLKWGIDFKEWNPEHPNGNFDLFRKGLLRAWCAGMPGANYNIIANDLEGVNYSSGRLGMLDERELWKLIQRFDIEIAERPIFENWLYMSLLTGAIPLPLGKFDKFNKPIFRGRRWAWVDPLKEVQSSALEVANKFTSRTRIIEDSDVDADFEQVLFELAEEEMLMEEFGMDSAPAIGKTTPQEKPDDTEEETGATGQTDGGGKSLVTVGKKDMTSREILSLILASKSESGVTVNIPPIEVPPPVVSIKELKLPEQKAPVVHVAAAEVRSPDVVVHVAPAAVKIENIVKVPKTKKMTVKRGSDGKMTEIQAEHED